MNGIVVKIIIPAVVVIGSAFSIVNEKTGKYIIDTKESQLKWTGHHLAKSYSHVGLVNIKNGFLIFNNGSLTSGEVVIDMTTITNLDLDDKKDNDKLVKDLKSKRFFNVKEYPEAKLVIKKATHSGEGKYNIIGDITIRGITKEISFEARQTTNTENEVEFTANLEVDRTQFEVMYGWSIENAILSNTFDLEVKLASSQFEGQ